MSYSSLRDFIHTLDSRGELIWIKEHVSPYLEITEITDRLSKHGGKAILFENNGTEFPLLINAYGSEKRMCLALGVEDLEDPAKAILELAGSVMAHKDSFFSKLSMLPTLAGIASWMPRSLHGRGKCQEVVMETPDLGRLPVLTCWPHDGGPFITLPVVHTVHPETGQRNVGMYRMQVLSATTTGMHWHLHKGSASHYREYARLGKRMPVAVALGGDPAYAYSATAPLPENVDEYLLAGFLRKKKVELVRCLTCDLEVPADADFVIEGYVDPSEDLVLEGPFGDHTGFYSLADYYPKFHVTCITHRKDAVYPATIVGIPPQEDAWIGKATERIFLSPIRLSMLPEIRNMVMPAEGVFHNIVLVKIHKTFPGQAARVMNSLWGAGQMMFNKVLIVLDRDIDLNDYRQVMQVITDNVDPVSDTMISRGPVDVLDHSSSRFALGGKLGIDATDKLPGEKPRIRSSADLKAIQAWAGSMNETCIADLSLLNGGIPVLMIFVEKEQPGQVKNLHAGLVSQGILKGVDWVIYLDRSAKGLGMADYVWLVANNIDPSRDCYYSGNSGCMAVDGTMKSGKLDDFDRDWPNVIVMDDTVISEIDRRWESLGIGGLLPSPSLRYRPLVSNTGATAG